MATDEKLRKGIKIGSYTEVDELAKSLKRHIKGEVAFFCIGTDRVSGDSLAPLIGTMLERKGYNNVIGTLEYPAHANNLGERINEVPTGVTVLAIDAALGKKENIGKFNFNKGELYAGKALGKDLPPIGDFNILGIVNVNSDRMYTNHQVLSSTRLHTVVSMAETVVRAIELAFPIEEKVLLNEVK